MAGKNPKITEEVLSKWHARLDRRPGISRWRVCGEIAGEWGLSQQQVYRWINPEAAERDRISSRHHYRRKAYESGAYRTRYHKFYARYLRRHPEELINAAFAENDTLHLDDIVLKAKAMSRGVRFGREVIKTAIKRYETLRRQGKIRAPAVEEIEPHRYRLRRTDQPSGQWLVFLQPDPVGLIWNLVCSVLCILRRRS